MAIKDIPLTTLDGKPSSIGAHLDKAALIVNVASRCGLTPQYETLEQLQKDYADRGFTVLGFPCNQFGGQEPGSNEEIAEFCSTTYGVTFPIFDKIDVNGDDRHAVYQELTEVADAEGYSGDVRWNFEKFLVDGDGRIVARFGPRVVPDSPEVVSAIESLL